MPHLTPFNRLESEALEYQEKMELPIDENNLEGCLTEAVQINARTGKMLADAQYYQDEAIKNNIIREMKELVKLPAMTLNKFISAYCKEENYLVNMIERLNKASDKKAKACITLISKLKAESFNQRFTV